MRGGGRRVYLEQDHEHAFPVLRVRLGPILFIHLEIGRAEEDVSLCGTPKNALKCVNARCGDDSALHTQKRARDGVALGEKWVGVERLKVSRRRT